MNKSKVSLFILLVSAGSFICACVPKINNVTPGTDTSKTIETSAVETESNKSSFKPFYVYEDFKSNNNHYSPSGWMGDVTDLELDVACVDSPYNGSYCLKIKYVPDGSRQWAGIYWQHPANNWGDKNGGYNVTGASKLTFWARGAQGYEVISEVKIGGISGVFSDSDVAWLKDLKLTREWKQYTIDLSKSDLSSISGGFCIVLSKKSNPKGCTIYLDEIRYE